MTTWTAGYKADATKVVAALQARYANQTKNPVRSWAIAEMAAAGVTTIVDLWGGELSAIEEVAAGMSVISVDNGQDALDLGFSAARTRRAMTVRGEAGGYRTGWVSKRRGLAPFLAQADGAFLDFMGHPCPETIRALEACRHMKALAVTLMGSRFEGPKGLPVDDYISMYRTFIEKHTGMKAGLVRKYHRPDKQWALVFVVRRHWALTSPPPSLYFLRKRSLRVDPEVKARKADYRARPEVKARKADYRARPEVKARKADHDARPEVKARKADHDARPEVKARKADYRARPEVKARAAVLAQALRARKKAERQAEGAP